MGVPSGEEAGGRIGEQHSQCSPDCSSTNPVPSSTASFAMHTGKLIAHYKVSYSSANSILRDYHYMDVQFWLGEKRTEIESSN